MIGRTAWCKACQRSTTIVDESIESAHTGPYTEADYYVTTLQCGHDNASIKSERRITW